MQRPSVADICYLQASCELVRRGFVTMQTRDLHRAGKAELFRGHRVCHSLLFGKHEWVLSQLHMHGMKTFKTFQGMNAS